MDHTQFIKAEESLNQATVFTSVINHESKVWHDVTRLNASGSEYAEAAVEAVGLTAAAVLLKPLAGKLFPAVEAKATAATGEVAERAAAESTGLPPGIISLGGKLDTTDLTLYAARYQPVDGAMATLEPESSGHIIRVADPTSPEARAASESFFRLFTGGDTGQIPVPKPVNLDIFGMYGSAGSASEGDNAFDTAMKALATKPIRVIPAGKS